MVKIPSSSICLGTITISQSGIDACLSDRYSQTFGLVAAFGTGSFSDSVVDVVSGVVLVVVVVVVVFEESSSISLSSST
jgi:hypothetical protein